MSSDTPSEPTTAAVGEVAHWWDGYGVTRTRCGFERESSQIPREYHAAVLNRHSVITCPSCLALLTPADYRERSDERDFLDEMGPFLR